MEIYVFQRNRGVNYLVTKSFQASNQANFSPLQLPFVQLVQLPIQFTSQNSLGIANTPNVKTNRIVRLVLAS